MKTFLLILAVIFGLGGFVTLVSAIFGTTLIVVPGFLIFGAATLLTFRTIIDMLERVLSRP
jgi:hypothetical protein